MEAKRHRMMVHVLLLMFVVLLCSTEATSAAPSGGCKDLGARFGRGEPMDATELAQLRTCVSDEIRSLDPKKSPATFFKREPGPKLAPAPGETTKATKQ